MDVGLSPKTHEARRCLVALDPLPAGVEPLDPSLATTARYERSDKSEAGVSEGRGVPVQATKRGLKVEYSGTRSELSTEPKTQGHSRIVLTKSIAAPLWTLGLLQHGTHRCHRRLPGGLVQRLQLGSFQFRHRQFVHVQSEQAGHPSELTTDRRPAWTSTDLSASSPCTRPSRLGVVAGRVKSPFQPD